MSFEAVHGSTRIHAATQLCADMYDVILTTSSEPAAAMQHADITTLLTTVDYM
jgi:hypothetical protein